MVEVVRPAPGTQVGRLVASRSASPVAVVTAMDGRRPHGTTVSAFACLSMTPPMVGGVAGERSHLLTLIRRTGRLRPQHPTRQRRPKCPGEGASAPPRWVQTPTGTGFSASVGTSVSLMPYRS
ncbi:flavin reductase [Streptomyces sp. 2A115]|uniref:flavin reductase n=1 Tax=Streptomyces sp. 2A115 TaxID=3457439 RepID=UPI003FD37A93